MIIPSSKFAENINQFLDDLSSGEKTEFAILHNERIEAIVISASEYERMYHTKIAYDTWRNDLMYPGLRMREYITSMGTTCRKK
jgi:PHD/YefM family antitoxin component YafN of YafNO toxin-antitoxin module